MADPSRALSFLELVSGLTWIDVRTREEYERGHLPGALHLPILDAAERAWISRIYYFRGAGEARLEALEIVTPRLPVVARQIGGLAQRGPVALYCWRGGARSTILGQLLSSLGLEVHVLEGGYRAHRRTVMAYLENRLPSLVVLHGYTGSGKTSLLRRLAQRYPVVDLEYLASHRGSTFGGLGLSPQPTQCQFESELVTRFKELKAWPVLVEAESPSIGSLQLPRPLCEAMRAGVRLFLDVPLEVRIGNLVEEYGTLVRNDREGIEAALCYLATRLPRPRIETWRALVDRGDMERLAEELLTYHYDPLYERWKSRSAGTFSTVLSARSMDEALRVLEGHLEASGLWRDRLPTRVAPTP